MRYRINKPKNRNLLIILSVFFIILFGLLFFKDFFVFLAICIPSALLQFFTYKNEIKFNVGHVFFFAMLLARTEHLFLGILFLAFTGILPQAFVGDIDQYVFVVYPIKTAVLGLSLLFITTNFAVVGIFSSIVCYGLCMFVGNLIEEPLPEIIMEMGLPMLLNIIYFFSFSGFFLELFKVLF
jgi:hypothetical protein